jgi:hypothetical protein
MTHPSLGAPPPSRTAGLPDAAARIRTHLDRLAGQALQVRVVYDNRSNVEISPQISLKIKKGETAVYTAIYPYPENQPKVRPGTLLEIPALFLPTANLENGKYEAQFELAEQDKFSLRKDFTFSLGEVQAASSAAENPASAPPSLLPWAFAAVGSIYLLPFLYARLRKRRQSF